MEYFISEFVGNLGQIKYNCYPVEIEEISRGLILVQSNQHVHMLRHHPHVICTFNQTNIIN